jgi:chromosome segregation ATPase
MNQIRSHIWSLKAEKSKLQNEIRKIQKVLGSIKIQLEDIQESHDFDYSDLQLEMSALNRKISDELTLKSKSERNLEKIQVSIENIQKELDDMLKRAANEMTIDENLRDKLRVCVEHLEEAKQVREKINRNIKKIQEKIKSFDGLIVEISAQISEYESAALAASKGERVKPSLLVEQILKDITKLRNTKISEQARLDSESS